MPALQSESCSIVIPAWNEANTIAAVIEVAQRAGLGSVIVVDDGSTDATAAIAQDCGATVMQLEHNQGKAAAVVFAARHLMTRVLVLLDADLLNLQAGHIQALAEPVIEGSAEMTRGDFVSGRWQTNFSQLISPVLNGQRALLREKLLSIDGLEQRRYGLEVMLAREASRKKWRVKRVLLDGVSQVMKEEKEAGFWPGVWQRFLMYRDILVVIFRP